MQKLYSQSLLSGTLPHMNNLLSIPHTVMLLTNFLRQWAR